MKTQHSFIAERLAAQHCAELLRQGPEPADLLPALARMGEQVARNLAPALARLIGGDPPTITPLAAAELLPGQLEAELGGLAATSLHALGSTGSTVLLAIEGIAVLRLVDRAFGGKGDASGPLPRNFPLSAELLIERLEQIVVESLEMALGQAPLQLLARAERIEDLAGLSPGKAMAILPIEVMEGAQAPWKLRLGLPLAALPKLLGKAATSSPKRSVGPADPAAAPFADMPLPLVATLVDMKMPLAIASSLAPGKVLPVAVARAVPLSIAGTVIARGAVGAQDDCVAIKLTQLAQ